MPVEQRKTQKRTRNFKLGNARLLAGIAVCLLLMNIVPTIKQTVNSLTSDGNLNVTAIVKGPAPIIPAVILKPTNNSRFVTAPLVVSGTCGPGLLVRIFNNNELAGSSACSVNGNFIINITLVTGKNTLLAMNYDVFDQPGPPSEAVIVYVDNTSNAPADRPSSSYGVASDKPKPDNDSIKIFSGTPLQPIAIIWNMDLTVPKFTHFIIVSVIYAILVIILIALLYSRYYRNDTEDNIRSS